MRHKMWANSERGGRVRKVSVGGSGGGGSDDIFKLAYWYYIK